MSKRKFIVTADDFGVTPIIDIAVRKAISRGIVSSVACFANGPDPSLQQIKQLRQDFPHVSIGCHFTITSGDMVSGTAHSLTRAGKNTKFRGAFSQHPDRATGSDLADELTAQLDLFRAANIPISHFSDHHGLLSYTKSGTEALLTIISDYSDEVGRQIPIRNPVFVGCTEEVKGTCLDGSTLLANAELGLAIKNVFRAKTAQKLKLKKSHLEATLAAVHAAGIPTTDYFIESFYANAFRATLKCIQRHTPGTRYHISNPVHPDFVISELMVHLAIRPGDEMSESAYEEEVKLLKKFSGIAVGYLRGKRVTEYRKLLMYFDKCFAPFEISKGFVVANQV